MEYIKNVFMIKDSSSSFKKWKENKAGIPNNETQVHTEGPMERSIKNRETAKQSQAMFEPYLNEIYSQFPQRLENH